MSASEPPAGASAGSTLPRSIDSFLETKLHWPRVRDGWVERQRLVDLFDQATRRPVALIAAPAGYGKTTLTAQWLANGRGSRAAAWVSLDAADNDPQHLWSHVGIALERAGCALDADVAGYMSGNSGDLVAGILPRLVHALAAVDDIVLILDDFHFLQSAACREQVEFLIEHLPESAHLVIVSRADPGLRLGRLRASGRLAEIRAEQLRFTREEATEVLLAERVTVSTTSVEQLMGRTEGWPAGVYLAGLSLTGREDADEVVRQSSGTDRFVTAYFLEEVISQGTERTRDFILTMSILDRFCAPLCDAMAGTTGSAEILDDLERRNLFVVPLDDERRWFRFHHLFGLAARSELESLHPERLAELHQRAATWYRDNGYVAEALTHLRAAGHRAGCRLIAANWLQFVDAGRAPTVLSWLQALGRNPDGVDPVEEVTKAWIAAIFGDEAGLARHIQLLEPFADHGPLPDGSRSIESALALIEGLFGYGGPVAMRAGAQRAAELETDGLSPFYCIAQFSVGHAAFVAGELNLATEFLDRAARSEAGPAIGRVQALSVQSLAEGELGHLDRSRELAERALGMVEDRAPCHAAGVHRVRGHGSGAGQLRQGERRTGDPRARLGAAPPPLGRAVGLDPAPDGDGQGRRPRPRRSRWPRSCSGTCRHGCRGSRTAWPRCGPGRPRSRPTCVGSSPPVRARRS